MNSKLKTQNYGTSFTNEMFNTYPNITGLKGLNIIRVYTFHSFMKLQSCLQSKSNLYYIYIIYKNILYYIIIIIIIIIIIFFFLLLLLFLYLYFV